ncbi:CRPV-136 [Crowpox virus]|nr:CRPV-136 [Crowpox virus]
MIELPSILLMTSVTNAIISSTLVVIMVNTNIILSTIFTLTLIVIHYSIAFTVLYLYLFSCVFGVNTIIVVFVSLSIIKFIITYKREVSEINKNIKRSLIILDLN